MAGSWSCRHFSLANGSSDPTNLPALLRKVADQIETDAIDPDDILDLVTHYEISELGSEWSMTLYWSPADES